MWKRYLMIVTAIFGMALLVMIVSKLTALPTVFFDTATSEPVGCSVDGEPHQMSETICEEVVSGKYHRTWVRPGWKVGK